MYNYKHGKKGRESPTWLPTAAEGGWFYIVEINQQTKMNATIMHMREGWERHFKNVHFSRLKLVTDTSNPHGVTIQKTSRVFVQSNFLYKRHVV